jgi:hypothetical protein
MQRLRRIPCIADFQRSFEYLKTVAIGGRMKLKRLLNIGVMVTVLLGGSGVVFAQAFIAIVTPSKAASTGWTGKVSGSATLKFVASPKLGSGPGNAQFTIENDKDESELRLTVLTWQMKLSDLGGLSYDTFVSGKKCDTGDKKVRVAPTITLDIDSDGDYFADDVLVFDPGLNGTISCEEWQNWNAATGLWYSSKDHDGPHHPLSLNAYRAAHPGATIVLGGVRIAAGLTSADWKEIVSNVATLNIARNIPCTAPACVDGPAGTYLFSAGP